MLGKFLHRSTLLFLERPDGEKETNSALISKQPFHNIIKSIYIKLFHYLSCFFITMENKSPEQVSKRVLCSVSEHWNPSARGED